MNWFAFREKEFVMSSHMPPAFASDERARHAYAFAPTQDGAHYPSGLRQKSARFTELPPISPEMNFYYESPRVIETLLLQSDADKSCINPNIPEHIQMLCSSAHEATVLDHSLLFLGR